MAPWARGTERGRAAVASVHAATTDALPSAHRHGLA